MKPGEPVTFHLPVIILYAQGGMFASPPNHWDSYHFV